jgi:hypothetical protein
MPTVIFSVAGRARVAAAIVVLVPIVTANGSAYGMIGRPSGAVATSVDAVPITAKIGTSPRFVSIAMVGVPAVGSATLALTVPALITADAVGLKEGSVAID